MQISRWQLWGTAVPVTFVLITLISLRTPPRPKPPYAAVSKVAIKLNWGRPNELTPEVAEHLDVLVNGQPLAEGPFTVTSGEIVTVQADIKLKPELLEDGRIFLSVKLACRELADDSDDWSLGKQPEWFLPDARPSQINRGNTRIPVPDRKGTAELDLDDRGLTGDCKLRVYAVVYDGRKDSRIEQSDFHYLLAETFIKVIPKNSDPE